MERITATKYSTRLAALQRREPENDDEGHLVRRPLARAKTNPLVRKQVQPAHDMHILPGDVPGLD